MNILVAISDEYFAQAILCFMKSRQWGHKDTVRLVHVLEPSDQLPVRRLQLSPLDDYCREQFKLVEDAAFEVKKCWPSLTIQKSIIPGKADEMIMRTAEEWPADLIIMGSHGREGLERLLLGSVSLAVTAGSTCSIVIVKPLQARCLDLSLCDEEDMPQQVCSINFSAAK